MFINPNEPLLNNRLIPITCSMDFLEEGMTMAAKEFHDWMEEINTARGINVRVKEIGGSIGEALCAFLPWRVGEDNRSLLIHTESDWTRYLDNNHHATDPSPISYLATRLGCRTVRTVSIPNIVHCPLVFVSNLFIVNRIANVLKMCNDLWTSPWEKNCGSS
jgi:hypothetical protein